MRDLALITGNAGKATEYSQLLGIPVTAVNEELPEIQDLDVRTVVEHKVRDAYTTLQRPVLVDDTGLTLASWNGLPGALVAHFLDADGVASLLDMATARQDRRATVTTAIGYATTNDRLQIVTGTLHGTIAETPRGHNGFGYDSVFIPDGHDRTYAEMTAAQKNGLSHRRHAVDKLRDLLR